VNTPEFLLVLYSELQGYPYALKDDGERSKAPVYGIICGLFIIFLNIGCLTYIYVYAISYPYTNMDTYRAALFLDKGGVGKTTSTAHLGVALSENHDVLLIDLAGKQNDLAKHFGLWEAVEDDDDRWPNISTVLDEDWETIREKVPGAVDGMILDSGEGPDLIPAHVGLDQADDELASVPVPERYQFVERFLKQDVDGYDVVLLDLPGLTNNITLNGLWATRHIVAPVELGPFEEKQMEMLLGDLEDISDAFDLEVTVDMVLPNRVDSRTTLADELLDDLGDQYPMTIAPEHIPQSQDIKNAQNQGQTVFALDEPSTTAARAQSAYKTNATALIDRLQA